MTQEYVAAEGPPHDVLEEGVLHKVMVFFHKLEAWPGWLVALVGLLPAGLVGWIWRVISPTNNSGFAIGGFMLLFVLIDLLVLISLPRWGISFGPWKAQFIVLGIPRWGAALLISLLLSLLGLKLGWGLFLFVQLSITAAYLQGLILEPQRLQFTELMTFTDNLPRGTAPLRILHISDLHIERLSSREEQVLTLAEQSHPDLIVISGDYVNLSYNRDPQTLRQVGQFLSRLKAPHGVYATLGSPPVDLRETVVPIFDELNIPLLRQDWQKVTLDDERELLVLGLDCTHHLPTDRARLAQLVHDAPAHLPRLFLYHSPELMPEAVFHGVDLYLCGHTHGGQVRLPLIGPLLTSSQLGRRFVMGLYKLGKTSLYVSRGIGMEGLSAPRVRFFCPPEITLIHLVPNA
jgi:predicted MPP superfamily phosphohydrolase